MQASAAESTVTAAKPIGVQWLLLALAIASAVVYLLIHVFFVPHAESTGEASAPGVRTEVAAPAAAPPVPEAPPVASAGAAESKVNTGPALKEVTPPKAARRKVAAKVEFPPPAPAEPPPPTPEPVPIPRPAPPVVQAPPDPWQAMNDGLSRCAQEDMIHRGNCEQLLRLQYCPGHWGVVWQCPIGPTLDHGR